MRHVFRRRPEPPALFAEFCTGWLGLSRTKTDAWWQALARSTWSRASALRQLVQVHEGLDQEVAQVTALYQGAMSPAALVEVLEDLVREEQMSPLAARRIEEQVLQKTAATGTWKETA